MGKIKKINSLIKPLGIELRKINSSDITRRMKLFECFKINKVFDVGANVGNYSLELRKFGFNGQIVAFEPLTQPFDKLSFVSSKDKKWDILKIALGDKDETAIINIAGNLDSSSLLNMLPSHLKSAPQTKYIGKEKIIIKKLDSIFDKYYHNLDNIYMKIDTQGFEKKVLEGSRLSLKKIVGLQIEMSLIPLYEDSPLYLEMINYLSNIGFQLFSLENGFSDPNTGQLLQVDGVFFRTDSSN